MLNVSSSSSLMIDYCRENRLCERFDGTIGLAEKPLGYVIGERVLAPMIDVVSSVSRSFFRMMLSMTHSLGNALSELHHFQFLPGVAAEDIPLCAQEELTCREKKSLRNDPCSDLSKSECKHLIYPLVLYNSKPWFTPPGRRDEIPALLEAFHNRDHEHIILFTFAWESSSMQWYRSGIKSKMDTALYADFLSNLERLYETHLNIFQLLTSVALNDRINVLDFHFSYYAVCGLSNTFSVI